MEEDQETLYRTGRVEEEEEDGETEDGVDVKEEEPQHQQQQHVDEDNVKQKKKRRRRGVGADYAYAWFVHFGALRQQLPPAPTWNDAYDALLPILDARVTMPPTSAKRLGRMVSDVVAAMERTFDGALTSSPGPLARLGRA